MPVRNRSVPKSPGGSAADVSPTSRLKSPTAKAVRRSKRNGNPGQLKINNMFPPKRSRTSSEDDVHSNKKIKLDESNSETENCKDTSIDSSTSNNTESVKNTEEIKIDDEPTSSPEQNNPDKSSHTEHESMKSDNLEDTMSKASDNNTKIDKDDVDKDNTAKEDSKNDVNSNIVNKDKNMDKCDICGQFLNNSDIIYYQGHPQDAVEEYVGLTNEKLVLASGEDGDIMERPNTNITGYSIYDKQGHLCAIDSGLVESDVRIYMSGYLKSICSDSIEIDEESIPVKDLGPIIEWYIHGFDGGDRNCITLSTEFGEYNLLKPSDQYKPLMDNLYEKIWISKVVVEYLEENHYLQPTYEDLLEIIRNSIIPELNDKKMSEEMLHKHAHFVCDQVVSLEAEEDEEPLITLPCMSELIKLMGIKFGKRKTKTKIKFKKVDKKAWTKATTTPLVRKTFESFFTNQLDKTNHELVLRRKRCGVCEACQLPDCGECNACRAMAKFGGHGRTKKACVRRLCPNMAVEQAEDSGTDDEPDFQQMSDKKHDKIDDAVPVKLTGTNRKLKWIDEPVKADATKVYYEKVEIDGAELCIGDYVMVETSQPNIPSLVARVVYMWQDTINPKAGYFHGEVFIRASDTVLGEVGDPREVFLGDRCCHGAPLSSILRKACVKKGEIPADWYKLGGKEVDEQVVEDDGKTYFYNKYYERFTARFEDLPENPTCPNELRKHRFCPSCERKTRKDAKNIPRVTGKLAEKSDIVKEANRTEWTAVNWQDYDYKKGCGVFLKPGTFKLKNSFTIAIANSLKPRLEKVDEEIYTEYYRKSDNNLRGSNIDTGEPFCVGHIAAVSAVGAGPLVVPQDIYLSVNVMYRPENTASAEPQREDLNLLYWSDEIRDVPFSAVVGACHLLHERNAPQYEPLQDWLERDPSRFYFRMAYDRASGRVVDVPRHAEAVGRLERGKGKGKGKSRRAAESTAVSVRPLRALDVFAGCGGLSAGLHRAGAADCRWAVENQEAAAHAYALNNRACTVFHDDCNELLRAAMEGAAHSAAGLRLPARGEVELLCGGPPCQGFSGMNRFNSREYSNFKNSLVASLLSYCDFYRPKYFILENVRNFVAFKRGMVLKLTLRALLDMGYQCTFGVVQAGHYGVPQTRRRLIILAAAPGLRLPRYPEPTHVFSRRACSLSVTVDGKRFATDARWEEAAPRRTCTVRDAMGDLPPACSAARADVPYGSSPRSHFQRVARARAAGALRDHVCKVMAPLVQARIDRVPTAPGADWRDLPNEAVVLADGTRCKVLQYRYEDKRNGRSPSGALRGVCACAAGRTCSPQDKQENTLIPWCLPHTGNRHNNWAGLYGRISWDGYFSTTVTDPEPMGKQGRVLHPEHSRVVSVRECARSQGFPDHYLFAGSLQDKHRQIGNAVPPPLGAALGREIMKALAASTPL